MAFQFQVLQFIAALLKLDINYKGVIPELNLLITATMRKKRLQWARRYANYSAQDGKRYADRTNHHFNALMQHVSLL